MERRRLQGVAVMCSISLGLLLAVSATGDAQTWRWKYVTRTPNTPAIAAQSTVAVTAGNLQMTYTVPLGHRQVVIESCRAALIDVASATTVLTEGRTYLLVQLKPSHAASCASGKRPAVALPTDDERYVGTVAAAINRSCCSAPQAVSANTTPAPRVSATLSAAPASRRSTVAAEPDTRVLPVPSATPASMTADWVESEGLFSFIRVRNVGKMALRIAGIDVFLCRDVGFGCGASLREASVGAHAVATIATISSDDQRKLPAFHYRYIAAQGDRMLSNSGSSAKNAPRRIARMTAQEVRTAEAAVLGTLRSTPPEVATATPARLVKRGSSRLAIGESGTALVRLMIASNGTPQEATIVSISNRRLAAAAIETAVSSAYAPATQNGKPIAAKYVATFAFDGTDPATASIPVWKRSPLPSPNALPSAAQLPTTPDPLPFPSVPSDAPSALPALATPPQTPAPALSQPPSTTSQPAAPPAQPPSSALPRPASTVPQPLASALP